jgi:hypothetical protein
MLKLMLWVGTPSVISFVASSYSAILENRVFLFFLAVVALIVAIAPRLADERLASGKR